MSLTPGSFFQSDATGATEVLKLVPTATAGPTQAQIVSAAYGNDTSDVTIAADGLSVTVTVQSGLDNLLVTVVSPSANDHANLVQGTTVFAQFVLTNHWDAATIRIEGL